MGAPCCNSIFFFYLMITAASLTIFHWSTTMQPSSPSVLNLFSVVHFRPFSRTCAFFITNAIILAILVLSSCHNVNPPTMPSQPPPPPLPPPPPPYGVGAQISTKSLLPTAWQKEASFYEDKVVIMENPAGHALAVATATSRPQKDRSRQMQAAEPNVGRDQWRRPLCHAEADMDRHHGRTMEELEKEVEDKMVITEELHSGGEEENMEPDELQKIFDTFIGKQMRFIKGEESMLSSTSTS